MKLLEYRFDPERPRHRAYAATAGAIRLHFRAMTARRLTVAIAAGLLLAAAVPMAQQRPSAAATQDPAAGRGRGGPPVQGAEEDLPLVATFDRNSDKRLDYAERTAAQ